MEADAAQTVGGPAAARSEHVKKWVAEQQKKEPCFICHQLGHWSQERPYPRLFPSSQPQQEDWALLRDLTQQEWETVGRDKA